MKGPFVDPVMAEIIEASAGKPVADLLSLPIEEARQHYEATWKRWNEGGPAMHRTCDLELRRDDGSGLRARLYVPGKDAVGLIQYLHGGGWMVGSIASHDYLVRTLAKAAGACIVSVEYRLAPEYSYPDLLDDVELIMRSVADKGIAGFPDGPLAIAGDSAGATLALSAMLRNRSANTDPICAAALFYGCYAQNFDTDSYRQLGDGRFGLSRSRMELYWRRYLGAPETSDPCAIPGTADLAGLPPIFLHAAGLDVLRDDTLNLSARLASADTPFQLDFAPGLIHGHLQMAGKLAPARRILASAGRFLRDAISRELP